MEFSENFKKKIILRFNLYSSFLYNLPLKEVKKNSIIFSKFKLFLENILSNQPSSASFLTPLPSPIDLIKKFFQEEKIATQEIENYLFKFIQIIEREVTLFDAIEEALFKVMNDIESDDKGSLHFFLKEIDKKWKLKNILKELETYKVKIVLTAHPTQFYPSFILNIISALSNEIKNKNIEKIETTLKQLAFSSFYNRNKPTPIDEAKSIIVYLKNVFYQVIPEIELEIEKNLRYHLPKKLIKSSLPNLIEIGFWPGGDKDGNPYVTYETFKQVLLLLKEAIIKCYINDLKSLKKKLTFKKVYPTINQILNNLKELISTKEISASIYPLEKFKADLATILSIITKEYNNMYEKDVVLLVKKINAFGYHFAPLDLRQNSKVHRLALKEIIKEVNKKYPKLDYSFFKKLSYPKKMDYIASLIKIIQEDKLGINKINLINNNNFSPLTKDTLLSLKTLFKIQQEKEFAHLSRYIISNNDELEDLLNLFFLAHIIMERKAGQGGDYFLAELNLDITPLFESINSLQLAEPIMEGMYKIAEYRNHLKNRNNLQYIMLGYSDGTKDGGYLSANWNIYQAKEKLTLLSKRYGIKVIFFDGRGGPPSRGGGNTHKFYRSLSSKIDNDAIELTIQGQTITSNFGSYALAKYNLEEIFIAGLEKKIFFSNQNEITPKNTQLMDEMSQLSLAKYQALINHPQFVDYLINFSPINYIGKSNIGSRPAKRNSSENDNQLNLAELRAIPFVSSWNQIKQNVPAFYGLGTALSKSAKANGLQALIDFYQSSLFFRAIIGNTIQSLIKSNFIYTSFIQSEPNFKALWQDLYNEKALTEEYILKISGKKSLITESRVNYDSIKFREKIVQPLIFIQQYALHSIYLNKLKKIKIADPEQPEKIIIRSLAGIINAGRNSA